VLERFEKTASYVVVIFFAKYAKKIDKYKKKYYDIDKYLCVFCYVTVMVALCSDTVDFRTINE
jgi:mannose/fructose/N-acetylgalactosamine-specific phosphotransferase system component IIB